jgi:hypothetical protein
MKRLHDVAVRMRPRVPRSLDGAPQSGPDTDASRRTATTRPVRPDAEAGFRQAGRGAAHSRAQPLHAVLARSGPRRRAGGREEDNASDAETPETGTGAQDEADDPPGVDDAGERDDRTPRPSRTARSPCRGARSGTSSRTNSRKWPPMPSSPTAPIFLMQRMTRPGMPPADEADADEDAVPPEAERQTRTTWPAVRSAR